MIGLLVGVLEKNQPTLAVLLLLCQVLNDTQSTFLAESCMMGSLGGDLEQNQQTLSILLLHISG